MIPNDVRDTHAAFAKLQALWEKLTRPLRVLIVEDDVNDVKLIKHAIAGYRVDVEVAITSSEAKQLLEQKDIDLCLLDLKMPDEPGTEVLRWARERKSTVPIVVLTGIDDGDPQIREALSLDAIGVFQKPLTPAQVTMILGAVK